ncbi:hypothetical protein B0H16DRAFT_1243016, partial [Mycena metata]
YTWATDPFNPARVERILEAVTIGPDLTAVEQEAARAFLPEYVDVFVLTVGEVSAAKGVKYAPRIPADTKFATSPVPQRLWTVLQAKDANTQIMKLEATGTLQCVYPCDVKCVNPITLSENDH